MTITFLKQLYHSHKANKLHGRYIHLDTIEPIIETFGTSVQVEVAGVSVQKRPIYSITIGTGKRRILLWSQMHGNESTTTKAVFDVLNCLIDATDPSLVNITERCSIQIIPILNPDGAKAYTRTNANDIDLNRDAKELTQPESKVLRSVFEKFRPDFCFNLHGQRTIFSAGSQRLSATLSFLAPAQDKAHTITRNRRVAMDLIHRIHSLLQEILLGQIGVYDDTYNPNCVGDTFQQLGVPTLLYEAGHYQDDYDRELVREFVFIAILKGLEAISTIATLGEHHELYFNIPKNQKLFRDIIIRNAVVKDKVVDIAIQYSETLHENKVQFIPIIDVMETSLKLYGHKEIDANYAKIKAPVELEVGNEIDFVTIKDEDISLFVPNQA